MRMDKSQRMLIAVGIGMWIVSPSIASADCQSVTTTDFVGQVCTSQGLEERTGKWIVDDGGTVVGTSAIVIKSDGSQFMTKRGNLTSPSFVGDLYRTEYKSATGVQSSREQLTGTWIIAPDYKLTGTYSVSVKTDGTMSVTDNRTRLALAP